MSYQANEVIPMLDEAAKEISNKKNAYGLGALMLLALAVTSFMAGHASSSMSQASAIHQAAANSVSYDPASCSRWMSGLHRDCGPDTYQCMNDIFYNGGSGKLEDCAPADASSSCEWRMDIAINFTCNRDK